MSERMNFFKDWSLEALMELAEQLAKEEADGHLCLMRFTGGWKAFLETPDLDAGDGRYEVLQVKCYSSLREALAALLVFRTKVRTDYEEK